MAGNDTLQDTKADIRIDDGEHEMFAHYVPADQAMEAYVEGKKVVALCGKIWVPHRDPDKFPVCPECKKIYDAMFFGQS